MVELDATDETRGPGGAVHGGLIASLVDRAAAYAVYATAQRYVATSNMTLSFLAGATGGPLRAEATTLRVGRQQGVVEVRVTDVGRDGLLVATALVTLSYLSGEAPWPGTGPAVGAAT